MLGGNSQDSNIKSLMDEITEGFSICNDADVYQVETFLGRGTYGLVARCLKNGTNQPVALKVMRKEDGYSANKELEAVLSLRKFNTDQINVMSCFDWFLYQDHYCFTYELLDRSLHDFMNQRHWSPLKVSEIRAITKQMLISLTALGELQMTHADIKPDNIMLVDHVSTPFRVKLIDFGFCHLNFHLSELDLIQAPCYRAPEVFLGFSPDEAVDMWGLGCVLGELFLGGLMFPGDSDYEILRSIVNLLGQPDKRVLDKAYRASQYFTLDQTDSTWRFKTATKYQEESGETISEESTESQYLDVFVEMASFIDNPHEAQDVREFIDLLKKMLAVNPGDRISPSYALKHNFITMKHLPIFTNDSYVKEAIKIMSQCQPITEEMPMECENTISSHPGPTMAPSVSTSPEAGGSDVIDKPLSYNPDDAQKHSFIATEHISVNNNDSYVNEAYKTMSQCQPITEDLPVECESSQSHTSHPDPTMAPPEKEFKRKKPFRNLRKFFARVFNIHHILS